jgi:GTP:adenosylcobinamide-phosphate guanylyltransferase
VKPFSALVLAGSRGGPDPVAQYAGVPHKALIRLGGRTLLARVAEALAQSGAARIVVMTGDAEVRAEAARLGAEVLEPAASPSASVRLGAEAIGTPLLVTTADHALLQPDWISHFLANAPPDAEVCALVARREVVEAAVPETKRTYFRLADGDWSGCNLFYLASPGALAAVDLWRLVEKERKRPWRIAGLLGPATLLTYAAGRLSLARAVDRVGRLAGVRAAAVATPFGLSAVDVDKPHDLDLARRLAED